MWTACASHVVTLILHVCPLPRFMLNKSVQHIACTCISNSRFRIYIHVLGGTCTHIVVDQIVKKARPFLYLHRNLPYVLLSFRHGSCTMSTDGRRMRWQTGFTRLATLWAVTSPPMPSSLSKTTSQVDVCFYWRETTFFRLESSLSAIEGRSWWGNLKLVVELLNMCRCSDFFYNRQKYALMFGYKCMHTRVYMYA